MYLGEKSLKKRKLRHKVFLEAKRITSKDSVYGRGKGVVLLAQCSF